MKVTELRAISTEDLVQKEKTLKKELFDLRYQQKIGRVEKPAQFKNLKREISRILTILNERVKDGTKS